MNYYRSFFCYFLLIIGFYSCSTIDIKFNSEEVLSVFGKTIKCELSSCEDLIGLSAHGDIYQICKYTIDSAEVKSLIADSIFYQHPLSNLNNKTFGEKEIMTWRPFDTNKNTDNVVDYMLMSNVYKIIKSSELKNTNNFYSYFITKKYIYFFILIPNTNSFYIILRT